MSDSSQPPSFLDLLHDSTGRALLIDFMRSGYSEHHLLFWEEVTFRYKRSKPHDDQRNPTNVENGCKCNAECKCASNGANHDNPPPSAASPASPSLPLPCRSILARHLYDTYIKNGCPSQINLTEPQRLRLQTAIERIGTKDADGRDHIPPCDLFDESASTCLELIKGNYYLPFQASKQYQTYRQEKEEQETNRDQNKTVKSSSCSIL